MFLTSETKFQTKTIVFIAKTQETIVFTKSNHFE